MKRGKGEHLWCCWMFGHKYMDVNDEIDVTDTVTGDGQRKMEKK